MVSYSNEANMASTLGGFLLPLRDMVVYPMAAQPDLWHKFHPALEAAMADSKKIFLVASRV